MRRGKGALSLSATGFWITVGTSVFLAILYLLRLPLMEVFELKLFDQRLRWRGELATTGEVVIVAIDEKSIAELGQWPWPRVLFAELIGLVTRMGPRSIGIDVIWSEPERRLGILDALVAGPSGSDSPRILKDLRERLAQLAGEAPKLGDFLRKVSEDIYPDRVLAQALEESGRVIIGDFLFMREDEVPPPREAEQEALSVSLERSQYPVVRGPLGMVKDLPIPKGLRPKGNLPEIGRAAKAIGFFNMMPDPDGVVRAAPLVVGCDEYLLAPLSIQTLRYAGNPSGWSLELESFGVAGIRWEKGWIPTSEDGFLIINYRGRGPSFPRISAVDLLKGRVRGDELRDKIVFIGAVATGIFDSRVTPFEPACPGVEVHANIVDNILKGDFIIRPSWVLGLDLLTLGFLGVLLGVLYPRLRPVAGGLLMIMLFSSYLWVNCRILWTHGLWLNLLYPSILIPMSYLWTTVQGLMREEREKRRIRGAFQVYVPPQVVQEILRDPEALKLGGEQRVLTVLFSDIRGFTSLSETLAPEELVRLVNEYLTEMTQVIFKYEGTLDKYIGDAIMAIYGAPVFFQDHPLRACRTALEMISVMKTLRVRWQALGLPALEIGVGINTGEMVVGNMGSEKRFDYTVMGDHVNLASRLEGLNKVYGTTIIVSEFTRSQIGDGFICRELDLVKVKGKTRSVRIYELLGEGRQEDWSWISLFQEGVRRYRARDWAEAARCFYQVLDLRPQDGPSRLYISRCEALSTEPPPPGWDGAFDWGTK